MKKTGYSTSSSKVLKQLALKDKSKRKKSKNDYERVLHDLQVELVKLQKDVIAHRKKILIIIEGRDAGGKDGAIKRITEHLSPRETRIVALGKPTERERDSWYFQRYVPHLPAASEIVLFNRSWYNRAGVEIVMGFCTDEERELFFDMVPTFEQLLVKSGIQLFKYYLDITKETQKKRLQDRHNDPLKQWKLSPVDAVATKNWQNYSKARNLMFARTHSLVAPWTIVTSDDKKAARLNLIRDILLKCDYNDKYDELTIPDPKIVFTYDPDALQTGKIAP